MKVYQTQIKSQYPNKKSFSPGESGSLSQDPGVYTKLEPEGCSFEQSSGVFVNKQLRENKEKRENMHLEPVSANSKPSVVEGLELELDNSYISRHVSPQTRSHQYISVYCSACGYRYIAPVRCPDWRICEHCRKRESFRLVTKYLKMIKGIPGIKLRLITLTIPNTKKLSREGIQKLRSYWIKLLHLRRYKLSISGGFYSIEAINRGRGWHVHLHALCEVKHQSMLPGSLRRERSTQAEKELSEDWINVTGNEAKIVSIRNVHSPQGSLFYILKDLLKSPDLSGPSSFEYLTALKQSRLLSTFGQWYAKVKDAVTSKRFNCPNCGNDIWIDQYFLRDIEEELNFARAP